MPVRTIFGTMRHFLAYIMLTIFSFQVLPVKELGKLLFKAQLTEEIHEDCETGSDSEMLLKEKLSYKETPVSYWITQVYLQKKLIVAIHIAAQIAHQHFPDIFVPPPNA